MYTTPTIEPDYQLHFIPSLSDISGYIGSNSYSCGLDEVESDVDQIIAGLSAAFLSCEDKEIRANIPTLNKITNPHTANYSPELLVKVGLLLSSGAASVLFYKLVENWVNHRNGRKFRVKLPNGLEVEASQLSQSDFLRLFKYLHDNHTAHDLEKENLEDIGFVVYDEIDRENDIFLRELSAAYTEKRIKREMMNTLVPTTIVSLI